MSFCFDSAQAPVVRAEDTAEAIQDGAALASSAFALVSHPSQAERQVEVSRHERTLTSYQEKRSRGRESRGSDVPVGGLSAGAVDAEPEPNSSAHAASDFDEFGAGDALFLHGPLDMLGDDEDHQP
ncbi:MAG TPA: DUF2381 family protein, partial [Archangium sp.]